MGTVASELKAEREKRNIPLSQIAAETRISLRHLESLEDGRFGDMPGGIYNRAFLKAYCEMLNLNVSDVMQRYENELSLAPEKPSRIRVQAQPRSRSLNISPIFFWGLMLAISASGLYFSRKWIAAVFSPYFSHAPAAPVRYETVKPSPPSEPVAQAPPQAAIMPAQALSSQGSSPAEAAPPIASSTNGSQVFQLEVAAIEQCWVSIERDGISAFRKIMQPGDIQSLDAADRFFVILGNAGGVYLKINGKPARPLGKPGSVVKILINRQNLQEFLEPTAG